MSQANVEIVRRAYEAVIRKPRPDFATINDLYHPDHELISLISLLEGGSHRGARGYRDLRLNTLDAVEWDSTVENVSEIDDNRVLVITPTRVRGKSSGVALKEERWGSTVTVRQRKITRTEIYSSPEQALRAAGVKE